MCIVRLGVSLTQDSTPTWKKPLILYHHAKTPSTIHHSLPWALLWWQKKRKLAAPPAGLRLPLEFYILTRCRSRRGFCPVLSVIQYTVLFFTRSTSWDCAGHLSDRHYPNSLLVFCKWPVTYYRSNRPKIYCINNCISVQLLMQLEMRE
jgi:hypothetical protein